MRCGQRRRTGRGSRGALALVALLAILLHALPGQAATTGELEDDTADYDPWQPFNERTFAFNYKVLDRYVMKPLGKAWDWLLPDAVQRHLDSAFENLNMPRRLVNHVLQGQPRAAGEEVGRFAVNTTVGLVGFFDVADRWGLHGSDADTGQTFGVWGIGPGPYLVVPFLPPLTVRDSIGRAVDGALDPIGYLVPVPLAVSVSTTAVRQVNERSLQPAVFENVEDTVIDLYSAVRNAYLQRRRGAVREGRADSAFFSCHRAPPAPPPEPGP
jgi:phospholipid-binding lipoprotein MlaA